MPVTMTTAVSGYCASTSLVKSIPDSPGMFTSLRTSAIGAFLQRAPAGGGALGGDAVVALRAEQAGEQGADLILVVDDQDPLAGGRRTVITRVIGRNGRANQASTSSIRFPHGSAT